MLKLHEKLRLLPSVASPPAAIEAPDIDHSSVALACFRYRRWAELLWSTLQEVRIRADIRFQGGQWGTYVNLEDFEAARNALRELSATNEAFRADRGPRYRGTITGVFFCSLVSILIGIDPWSFHWVLANVYIGSAALLGGVLVDMLRWSYATANGFRITILEGLIALAAASFFIRGVVELGTPSP